MREVADLESSSGLIGTGDGMRRVESVIKHLRYQDKSRADLRTRPHRVACDWLRAGAQFARSAVLPEDQILEEKLA